MPGYRSRGFALVVTLVLLAMLVLAFYALSALGRVGADITSTADHQAQAQQTAMLGMNVALGELQRFAGKDAAITGMAGVAGVAPGAGNPARHWCGVWNSAGQFLRWLASGGESGEAIPVLTGPGSVPLLATGALGADGTDKEHVRVLILPVNFVNAEGVSIRHGGYAWWVGDEGVKLSAVLPDADTPVFGEKHAINELITSLSPTAANLTRVESYAQLALVPSPSLTPGQLQSNLHGLGRTHYGLVGTTLRAGLLNINSTSVRYWLGVGATYNRLRPTDPIGIALNIFADRLHDGFVSASSPDKSAGGPFLSVDAFLDSALLDVMLQGSGVTPQEFGETMQAWLTVRSDTFRIRAYGESVNPSDSSLVESSAWCEAVVQRSPEDLPGFGRRFVITYFRWLGPDDL